MKVALLSAAEQQSSEAAASQALAWAGAVLVGVAAVASALPPLHEMDLAQHLAQGEWIVRQRGVPFTEPFAWTREGQPYFAYSWLAQVVFYGVLRYLGPAGLHLLEGLLAGCAVAAMLWAGKQLGWRPGVRLAVAVLHLALLWGVASTIRPQQFLFITIPLAWGIAAAIRRSGPSAGWLLGLVAVGALAANTHLFFPLTAAPLLFWLASERPNRSWVLAALALLLGWLLSPYGLSWPRVFALNFRHNVLLGRPPSIQEFVPGFEYASERPGVLMVVGALLLTPWLVGGRAGRATRETVAGAVFWTGGLLLFAYAGRLVLAWWTLALPLVGLAAARIETAAAAVRGRATMLVAAGLGAVVLLAAAPPISPVFWLFEGGTTHRMLPRAGEDPALWLPGWLLCHTRPGASGRLFTEFNYGSELNWRLPGYSPSIDGRTIFPDSVAVDFSMQPYGRQRRFARTWEHAELALLDRSHWLAPVLDQHPEWLLLADGRRTSRGSAGALWVKQSWWQRWGTPAEVPALDVRVGDPRATCAATGVFPK